jgi:hypothetical protein
MADAIREAYGDLFAIKARSTPGDRELIEGKFKSVHNASPHTAKLMGNTFFALLDLADLSSIPGEKVESKISATEKVSAAAQTSEVPRRCIARRCITTFRFICQQRST